MYRQTGSLGLLSGGKSSATFARHAFFDTLDRYAANQNEVFPAQLDAFLKSDCVFAAACFAAGWTQAGLRLARNVALCPEAPSWAKEYWAKVSVPSGKE
jgi:hypothetical protein